MTESLALVQLAHGKHCCVLEQKSVMGQWRWFRHPGTNGAGTGEADDGFKVGAAVGLKVGGVGWFWAMIERHLNGQTPLTLVASVQSVQNEHWLFELQKLLVGQTRWTLQNPAGRGDGADVAAVGGRVPHLPGQTPEMLSPATQMSPFPRLQKMQVLSVRHHALGPQWRWARHPTPSMMVDGLTVGLSVVGLKVVIGFGVELVWLAT